MDWPQGNEVQVVVITEGNNMFGCKIMSCDSSVTVHPQEQWKQFFMTGAKLVLKSFRTAWCENEVHIYLDMFSKIFPCPSKCRGEMKVAELFAGLGGWSNAGKELGLQTSIYVDSCKVTAEACAKTHKCEVMTAEDYIAAVIQGDQPETVVLWADVTEGSTWMAMTMANVGYVLGSPPCQPWSGAGRTKGLLCDDGLAFQKILLWGAKVMVLVMVLENVSNIVKHPDYQDLLKEAALHGMRLIMADCFEISRCSPVQRERWLGTFVHSSFQVLDDNVRQAKEVSLASDSFVVDHVRPCLLHVKGFHVNMTESERQALIVDEDAHLGSSVIHTLRLGGLPT